MKTYTITKTVTEKEIEEAKKWKAIAAENNLSMEELKEVCYHVAKIKEILNKKRI